MALSIKDRFQLAWDVFRNNAEIPQKMWWQTGSGSATRPDRKKLRYGTEKSIIAGVYNQIALDCASIAIRHVRVDENNRYLETIEDSNINEIFSLSANTDQTGPALIQDAVMSMFEEGSVAIVPTGDSVRTAKILEWYPQHIRVEAYNENVGKREEVTVPKSMVAIIENPLYAVMNEPNSTLKRLIRKLNILDSIDEQSGSGKLDMIIQLPYTIKSETRKEQAEKRRANLEEQLRNSKYGIGYLDATERITQLNRPVDNNLMSQIEYLTSMLYSQLGMTKEIFDGTADEATMLNYNNRTIDPILSALCLEMKRKWLTKTARTQRQSIMYFKDPFRLVPVNDIANIADKFTRNEILSPNEVRAVIGFKPSSDPQADELRNRNISAPNEETPAMAEQDDE